MFNYSPCAVFGSYIMKKTLIMIIVAIVFGVTVLLTWLRFGVDERQIQALLEKTLGPEYSVEIASARVSPIRRAVYAGGLSIVSDSDGLRTVTADTLVISGIGLRSFFGKTISVSTLELDKFVIEWSDSEEDNGIPFQRLAIRDLDLSNGTLLRHNNDEEGAGLNELHVHGSIDFRLRSDETEFAIHNSAIAVDSLGFLFGEDRYRISISEARFMQDEGEMSLSSLRVTPVGGYEQFMASLDYQTDMFELEVDDYAARGVELTRDEHGILLIADSISFGYFDIHIADNKSLPERPGESSGKLLNQIVQDMGVALQIDLISFKRANIRYSEQAPDGVRPGTVSFMNSIINMYDINSRSSSPAVIRAATYLQDHSRLATELRFTLDDGVFIMSGAGTLDSFEMERLNTIFKDLEGLDISSGTSHELKFEFEMIGDHSSGNMHLIYENLSVHVIDKDDHTENLISSFKSLYLNIIELNSENLPHENGTVRTGEISYERPPEESFFRYLWYTLRSGILDVIADS
jgi:hypothetical protein